MLHAKSDLEQGVRWGLLLGYNGADEAVRTAIAIALHGHSQIFVRWLDGCRVLTWLKLVFVGGFVAVTRCGDHITFVVASTDWTQCIGTIVTVVPMSLR